MTSLIRHRNTKAALLKWYDHLLEHAKLLSIGEGDKAVTEASLIESRRNLESEQFIVAICGQMNAGKSTLLNALLFGRPVLPHAATTMTAKIALISGADEDSIKATFYTEQEFAEVVRAATKSEGADSELRAAREAASKQGLSEEQLLRSPPHIEERANLDTLAEFVALPSKGGLYTPYVKLVHIQTSIPWLTDLVVADTPGTNDPNPERDKITKEWISRADAVIYVTYAGQAGMDQADLEFIDTYLRHIDSAKRLIAVNKCDTQEDRDAINSHFRRLGTSGSLRDQALFSDESSRILVSARAALIAEMQKAGAPLPAALADEAEALEIEGWLDPKRHQLDLLRSTIERRIIENKGAALIESNERRISSVFERAIRINENLREESLASLEILNTDAASREAEKIAIRQSLSEVSETVSNAKKRINQRIERTKIQAIQKLQGQIFTSICKHIDNSLRNVRKIDNIASQVPWVVNDAISKAKIDDIVVDMFDSVEQAINEAEEELTQRMLTMGFSNRRPQIHLLQTNVRVWLSDIRERMMSQLSVEHLQDMVSDVVNMFRRFFNTNNGRIDAIEAITPKIMQALHAALSEDFMSHLSNELEVQTEQSLGKMEESLNYILESRQKALEEFASIEFEAEERKGKLNELVSQAATAIDQIVVLQKAYEHDIEQAKGEVQ